MDVSEDGPAVIVPNLYSGSDPNPVFTLDATMTSGLSFLDEDGLHYDPGQFFQSLKAGETATDGVDVLVFADGVETTTHYDFTIQGVNDAPSVIDVVSGTIVHGGDPIMLTLPQNLFNDVDGDLLTVSVEFADGSPLPAWLSFDAATGRVSGSAPSDFSGQLDLVVHASDGAAAADAPFTISVIPQTERTIAVGEDDFGQLVDPIYAEGHSDAVISIDSTGTAGTVRIDPEGNIRYFPSGAFDALARDETGHDSFKIVVDIDGVIKTWTYTVDVAGANDAPVPVGAIDPLYIEHGTSWSFTVPDTLFADPDGDPLSYTAYANVTEALPTWMQFDAATRTFSGEVPSDFSGPIDLKIQASDGLATGGVRFTLNVTSGPAVVHPLTAQSTPEDTFYSFTLPDDTFINLSGAPLTYTATMGSGAALVDWLTFDPVTHTISGQPPANYTGGFNILISVSDGETVASTKFNLSIYDVPEAPTDLNLTTPWVGEFSKVGSAVGILSTSDPDQIDNFTYHLVDDANGAFALVNDTLVVNGYLDSHVNGGIQHVTVRSTDASGFSIDRQFTIYVQGSEAGELFAGVTPTRTIWVATNGVDVEGGGNADTPFASIQFAIDHAMPGTAIMVHGGTYTEALTIINSGTTDAPIWLISADGVGAAEIKPVGAAETNAIDAQGIQNYVIEGFRITGTNTIGTYGLNIVSKNNGAKASYEDGFSGRPVANLLIKDNIITNWGIDGVHVAQSFNVQVLNNVISGAHEQGIDFITAQRLVIAGNSVSNITPMPTWFGLDQRDYTGDSAITVKGGSNEVLILNNVIGNTNGYGIKVGAPSGISFDPITFGQDSDGAHYASYEANDVIVRGNTVVSSAAGAIDLYAATNVLVEQNLITQARMTDFSRGITGLVYGSAEGYLPLGANLHTDDIVFLNNVYKAATLHDVAEGVNYVDQGNVHFDPNATYSADDYAFVLGTNVSLSSPTTVVNGNDFDNILFGDAHGVHQDDYIRGRGGNDTMSGGYGDDVYVFDTSSDVALEGFNAGTDTVILTKGASRYVMPLSGDGMSGNIENVIVARNGNTSVIGNALDNVITGAKGNDQLRGNAGDDHIYGAAGDDLLNGGDGRDHLYGGNGADSLFGGIGNDVLEGGAGRDRFDGGAGDDMIISYDGDIRINGGLGIDLAYIDRSTTSAAINIDISYFGHGEAAKDDPRQELLPDGTRLQNIERIAISSGSGADHITGGFFADEIAAGAGNDYVNGHDGNDLIWGADGQDQLFGGNGNDQIDGGLGSDYVYGDAGDDTITSMEADFVLDGGAGVDMLVIDRSGSTLGFTIDVAAMALHPDDFQTLIDGTAISGFESIDFSGGDRNDIVYGSIYNDRFNGAEGVDTFYGGAGSDRLQGGGGDDFLYGGTGGDIIVGGMGADSLWGGGGDDTFKYVGLQPQGDIIYDFEGAGKAKGDVLNLSGYGPGATLTYDGATHLWTVASLDHSIMSSFTILGVTSLIKSDYVLA